MTSTEDKANLSINNINKIALYQGGVNIANEFIATIPQTLPGTNGTQVEVTNDTSILLFPVVSVGIKIIPFEEKLQFKYTTSSFPDELNQLAQVGYVLIPANAVTKTSDGITHPGQLMNTPNTSFPGNGDNLTCELATQPTSFLTNICCLFSRE